MKNYTVIYKGDGRLDRQNINAYNEKDAKRRFILFAECIFFTFNILEILKEGVVI